MLLSPVVRPEESPKLALLIDVLRTGATLLEDEELGTLLDELLLAALLPVEEADELDPTADEALNDELLVDELLVDAIWITGLR